MMISDTKCAATTCNANMDLKRKFRKQNATKRISPSARRHQYSIHDSRSNARCKHRWLRGRKQFWRIVWYDDDICDIVPNIERNSQLLTLTVFDRIKRRDQMLKTAYLTITFPTSRSCSITLSLIYLIHELIYNRRTNPNCLSFCCHSKLRESNKQIMLSEYDRSLIRLCKTYMLL